METSNLINTSLNLDYMFWVKATCTILWLFCDKEVFLRLSGEHIALILAISTCCSNVLKLSSSHSSLVIHHSEMFTAKIYMKFTVIWWFTVKKVTNQCYKNALWSPSLMLKIWIDVIFYAPELCAFSTCWPYSVIKLRFSETEL